jgi:glyoxylase-like metal-dependent hydrolase (beta-lactamase superfamily II)/ferredoxin
MADPARRLAANVAGDFFVDESCIDCGACMWIAPETFRAAGDKSCVHHQPPDAESVGRAELALVACPTGSIGAAAEHDLARAAAAYPRPFAPDVLHVGFHDPSTYGATSWLLLRRSGNVLVDAPRFSEPLERRLEELGGVKLLFLTHRDDVGEHARFAARFGCKRVLHRADLAPDTRTVERVLDGVDPIELAGDLLAIPTPGHTRGSACLLYSPGAPGVPILFSGDHVAWSLSRNRPRALRDVCWHSFKELGESMARLARHRFEWVLPGHGAPGRLPPDEMAQAIAGCAREILASA